MLPASTARMLADNKIRGEKRMVEYVGIEAVHYRTIYGLSCQVTHVGTIGTKNPKSNCIRRSQSTQLALNCTVHVEPQS